MPSAMADGGDHPSLLGSVQARLAALDEALCRNDADALAAAAAALQPALLALRRAGPLSTACRLRLAGLAAQMAAQHEALARAGASLKRSADMLLPGRPAGAGYAADGLQVRPAQSGWTHA
jgi:hypothetical protein